MRNLIFIFFSLLLLGCKQEDFSPVRNYEEKLFVSCVLDSRCEAKILAIQKSLDSWNLEDRLNISKNITAKLISEDTTYIFKDTIIGGVTNFKCFYFKSSILPCGYYTLQINDSSLQVYKNISSTIFYPDKMNISVKIVNSYYEFGHIANNNRFHAYIFYKQKINNEWIIKKEELPFVWTTTIEGVDVLFFPDNGFQNDISFLFKIPYQTVYDCYHKILTYADKDDLIIMGGFIIFESYDINLPQYIETTNGFFDLYSVRLDQLSFSNINNGLGIFGGIRVDTIKWF